ncbi:MAG: SRPBCC family protein [Bacteroidota bacterium]
MNVFYIILGIIISLILLVLIIAAFARKKYSVVRATIIKRPKEEVFNYIKLLKNQENFSKWVLMDPGMEKEYIGTDGTVGFISAWDSDNKNVGKGDQTITQVIEGERVDYELHFIKPFEGRANAFITTEATSEGFTKVRWGFDSKMKYPMNIMLLFMNMEKMIGDDFSSGLNSLKIILEK